MNLASFYRHRGRGAAVDCVDSMLGFGLNEFRLTRLEDDLAFEARPLPISRRRNARLVALGSMGALSFALLVSNNASAGSKARAQSLLKEGKRLMAAHQYHRACPKIAESQAVAPSASTLLQLALCHEQAGMFGTAFSEFNTLVAENGSGSAAKTAHAHIDALVPKVTRLTIRVPPQADSNIRVMIDGHQVPSSQLGLPQPIDPGAHEITATAEGRQRWTTRLSVGLEADEKVIDIPVMARNDEVDSPARAAEKESALEKPTYGEPPPEVQTKESAHRSSRAAFGNFLIGTGVVAGAIGTYYGFRAISLRKDSDAKCSGSCTLEGVNINEQAKQAAWISDFGIGIGLIGIVAGAYLTATTPGDQPKSDDETAKSIRIAPAVGRAGSGVIVRGAF